MPRVYLLVVFLGLLSLSTLTTAEQYDALSDRALVDRFCLRGYRSRARNPPPPQSTEKSLEKTSTFSDAATQDTAVEPDKMSEDDMEEAAMKSLKGRRNEDNASDNVKMSAQKAEEANKFKPAAVTVAADSPFKPKRSTNYDFEDTN